MNQPNLSTMAPKTVTASSDSPEILGMIKRYAWLLIGGAVAGAAVSGGYFAYALRYQAQYTSRAPFQVLPPPPPIGQENTSTFVSTPEDTSQVINRQVFLFQQDKFLTEILAAPQFHPKDKPNSECDWLRDHKKDTLYWLKRDLTVVPRLTAGSFEITMTTHDPSEARALVAAAAEVYQTRLLRDSQDRHTRFLNNLGKVVNDEKGKFQTMSDSLADYSQRRHIDVLKSSFEIEKNALQSLNDDYTRAEAAAQGAEQQTAAIAERKKNGKEIELSSELLQGVENDYTLKTLMNTRLQWMQEMAAALKDPTTSPVAVNRIQARLDEIDKEMADTRSKLISDARDRMEKMLNDEASSKRFLADYIGKIRGEHEKVVTQIAQDLLQWQQKVDELKEQGDLVNRLNNQYNLINANQSTDDTRVSPMDEPVVPDSPSWPKWYMFLLVGTPTGLLLSGLLAYLLMLTDTRVHTTRDLARTLQLPVLGFVPDESDDRMLNGDVETAILSSPASMVAESFRQIRSHITAQTAHNPVNTIIVTSIGPGGGATTVASNLAAAMALNDLRVLLVDANFYRPSLNRVFKGLPKEGLTDVVADPSMLDACIMPHQTLPRLHVMGAGTATSGAPSELFECKSFREVLDNLKSKYDMVIFDGAPISLVNDSMALAARVDGVIPVVRAGEVSRGAVSRLRDQIRSVHGNLIGFVLNAAQTRSTGYFKENYRSFYKYAGKSGRANGA